MPFDSFGNLDLGGGISINNDGSVEGGTFNGSGNSFINSNNEILDSLGNVINVGNSGGISNINGNNSGGGLNLNQGLGLSAISGLLGTYASQQGVNDARDLINTYGGRATDALNSTIANQRALNTQNTTALRDIASSAQNNVNDVYNRQRGVYDQTNAALGSNYNTARSDLGNVYNQQVGYQQPYQAVGKAGSQGLIDNQGYFTHQFDKNDLTNGLAPNYDFMLQQGQMANQRAANASGGGIGGNALTGLNKFTQDYAGNAYQNAFNNYQGQRNNIYNALAGMTGIGQTSTGQLTSLGNTYGTNLGNLSSNYANNLTTNAGQLQSAGNQLSGNLTGISNNLGSNLTSSTGQLQTAENNYGTNVAGLNTGLGAAQAQNATAGATLNAGALQALGNTALLSSILGQRGSVTNTGGSGGGGGGGGDDGFLGTGVSNSDIGTMATIASFFSDERMKENIEFVEQTPKGINIYDFDYKPEFKDLAGHGRFRGVMAQEIEKFIPSAVKTMFNGYKAVDYSIVFPEVTYA